MGSWRSGPERASSCRSRYSPRTGARWIGEPISGGRGSRWERSLARRSRGTDAGRTVIATGESRTGRRTPRGVALEVLVRTETTDAYADRLLEARADRADLDPRDRGLATELVLGTLR